MGNKKQITFTESVEVKDHNGQIEFKADVGECMELVETSAARWVNRRKAVYGKLEAITTDGNEGKTEAETGAELKKAGETLTASKERYQKAFTAHQKKPDDKTSKALSLAANNQEKKQQEYNTLVEASEKE